MGRELMLGGKNQNVTHRGKTFHIQTEDTGLTSTMIMTHIFLHGHIVATHKQSYRDIALHDHRTQMLQKRMNQQHQQMVDQLLSGHYDAQMYKKKPDHASQPDEPSAVQKVHDSLPPQLTPDQSLYHIQVNKRVSASQTPLPPVYTPKSIPAQSFPPPPKTTGTLSKTLASTLSKSTSSSSALSKERPSISSSTASKDLSLAGFCLRRVKTKRLKNTGIH